MQSDYKMPINHEHDHEVCQWPTNTSKFGFGTSLGARETWKTWKTWKHGNIYPPDRAAVEMSIAFQLFPDSTLPSPHLIQCVIDKTVPPSHFPSVIFLLLSPSFPTPPPKHNEWARYQNTHIPDCHVETGPARSAWNLCLSFHSNLSNVFIPFMLMHEAVYRLYPN